jgi:uncharacterized membrane protein YfcA
MDALPLAFALIGIVAAFGVSAAAGFGGSLVLVPVLALVLGSKEGVALAALLLACNNVAKVAAYRRTLPFRRSLLLAVLVSVGAATGATLFTRASDEVVSLAVVLSFALTFWLDRRSKGSVARLRAVNGPLLAWASGALSGFSGTSGPLKGVAVRSARLDRAHTVGCLSLLSLAGDATKTAVFTEAGLLTGQSYAIAVAAVPLMVVATAVGKRCNQRLGERGYRQLFWGVMLGYTGRLLLSA